MDVLDAEDARNMKLRKLQLHEHIRTRKLWEEIFTEDTSEFLDYYFSEKTKDNEIYVIEDNDEIVSMLHLNPYEMRINDKLYRTHYIVAVATKESYRKCGLMRRLMNHALQIMTDRGEPFTFLMPAAEAIYKPFGFEFVYEQKQGKQTGEKDTDTGLELEYATEKDCNAISEFANQMLQQYEVVTWRNEEYYRILLAELASEDGGILLAKRNGELKGVFCYAKGEHVIMREPLFCVEQDLKHAIYELTSNGTEEVLCIGYGEERKPMIMAKVLNPEFFIDLKKAKVFLNEVV